MDRKVGVRREDQPKLKMQGRVMNLLFEKPKETRLKDEEFGSGWGWGGNVFHVSVYSYVQSGTRELPWLYDSVHGSPSALPDRFCQRQQCPGPPADRQCKAGCRGLQDEVSPRVVTSSSSHCPLPASVDCKGFEHPAVRTPPAVSALLSPTWEPLKALKVKPFARQL